MRRSSLLVFFIALFFCSNSQELQLAPPLVRYSSAFFSGSTVVAVLFDQPGASVRYTLNGKEPDNSSPLYNGPITIHTNAILKVKAVGKNFIPSETVQANFTRKGIAAKAISFSTPHSYYANSKKTILQDTIGGIPDFRNGNWLGYTADTATITIELPTLTAVKKIVPDLLRDQGSWIFLPERLLVYYYNEQQQQYVQAAKEIVFDQATAAKQCVLPEILFRKKISTRKLKLVLLPLKAIPDWHAGKGQPAWFFIDEINIY